MSNAEWARIEPLLPLARTGVGRPMELDMRMVVNAIFYLVRTGCQWDDLPKSYPHHNSVYYHYSKWTADGTWQAINTTLRQCVRQQQGRNAEPSAAIIDSQSVTHTFAGADRVTVRMVCRNDCFQGACWFDDLLIQEV